MSDNNFAQNYQFGVKHYRRLLDIFYKHFCYDARFVCIGDLEKSPFSEYVQRTLKTDTVIQTSVHTSYGVEEKVVSWPANNQPYTAFFLETRSCTNPGHESPGWMITCQADMLLYAFEIRDLGLIIYLLDFHRLKRWFEQEYLPHLPHPEYGLSVMPDENRTEGRLVSIAKVIQAVHTRCFVVTVHEAYHEIREVPANVEHLREWFSRKNRP